MKILLNILGILIYFITRYARRTKKTSRFSFKYWIKDNWPEFSTTLLIDIALMILLFAPGTDINFDDMLSKLPFAVKLSGSLLMSFLLGLGLSSLLYAIFQRKIKSYRKR